MSRYTQSTYDFVYIDHANDVDLPAASQLIFEISYEYAPATPHGRVTPGEAADVGILGVNLKHIAPRNDATGGHWEAFREPTIQERATAEIWLDNQCEWLGSCRRGWVGERLVAEILAEEEQG